MDITARTSSPMIPAGAQFGAQVDIDGDNIAVGVKIKYRWRSQRRFRICIYKNW